MEILISGQYGDPASRKALGPIQRKLNVCFKTYVTGDYFKSDLKFAIAFRVSGKIWDFKSEGAERLKYFKKDNTISIDLVFPESKWLNVDFEELKKYAARGTFDCLDLMVEKSTKLGELVNKDALFIDIEKAMTEFLA